MTISIYDRLIFHKYKITQIMEIMEIMETIIIKNDIFYHFMNHT